MWSYARLNGRTVRIKAVKYQSRKPLSMKGLPVVMQLSVDGDQLAKSICTYIHDTLPGYAIRYN